MLKSVCSWDFASILIRSFPTDRQRIAFETNQFSGHPTENSLDFSGKCYGHRLHKNEW